MESYSESVHPGDEGATYEKVELGNLEEGPRWTELSVVELFSEKGRNLPCRRSRAFHPRWQCMQNGERERTV